jgi:hypothetical protein
MVERIKDRTMRKILLILTAFFCLSAYSQVAVMGGGVEDAPAGYTTQFQAVLDAWTTDPTGDTLTWFNDFTYSLDTAIGWSDIDLLNVYAITENGDSEALLDWANTDSSTTAVSSPTWTKTQGYTGGSSSYLNTNRNLLNETSNFQQDDGSVTIYLRIDQAENGFEFGARLISSEECHLQVRTTAEVSAGEMNGGTFQTDNSTGSGTFTSSRTSSTATALYRNGTSIDTDTDTSTGLPNAEMFVLNRSGSAGYSTNQVAIFMLSRGLSITEAASVNTIFETLMDNFGTGVQ